MFAVRRPHQFPARRMASVIQIGRNPPCGQQQAHRTRAHDVHPTAGQGRFANVWTGWRGHGGHLFDDDIRSPSGRAAMSLQLTLTEMELERIIRSYQERLGIALEGTLEEIAVKAARRFENARSDPGLLGSRGGSVLGAVASGPVLADLRAGSSKAASARGSDEEQ